MMFCVASVLPTRGPVPTPKKWCRKTRWAQQRFFSLLSATVALLCFGSWWLLWWEKEKRHAPSHLVCYCGAGWESTDKKEGTSFVRCCVYSIGDSVVFCTSIDDNNDSLALSLLEELLHSLVSLEQR